MASLITYYSAQRDIANGTIDLDTSGIYASLHSSAYTPNRSHETWASASASEITHAGAPAAGGVALTSKSVALSGTDTRFSATIPGITPTGSDMTGVRYMILRKGTGAGVAGDPLIGYIDLQSGTGFTGTVTASYTLNVSFANGILLFQPGA